MTEKTTIILRTYKLFSLMRDDTEVSLQDIVQRIYENAQDCANKSRVRINYSEVRRSLKSISNLVYEGNRNYQRENGSVVDLPSGWGKTMFDTIERFLKAFQDFGNRNFSDESVDILKKDIQQIAQEVGCIIQ